MLRTTERNNQIVIELLKKHGIRKIVASPGGTNFTLIASIQNDPFFEIYSAIDERSAGYIACGLAEETGERIVLSCTGATAARNYFSALTEAYYDKLPILAITSTMPIERIGHNYPQLTDRRTVSNDIVKKSYHIPIIKDSEDEWYCTLNVNDAILELTHNYNGPVHINLETNSSLLEEDVTIKDVKMINRIELNDEFPSIKSKKVAIFIGRHSKMSDALIEEIDKFCEKYNAIVIGDHTSNYKGKYMVPSSLIACQLKYKADCVNFGLLIHLGNISGSYLKVNPDNVWRVNTDGKLCDNFKKLSYAFEMNEIDFFKKYNNLSNKTDLQFYSEWKNEYEKLYNKIPEIPFSNAWVAKRMISKLPKNSVLHLGILNSLRCWNFFEIDKSINVYSNTGGFGIDGCVSTLLGASLVNEKNLYFGVVGDLAFFYDMNCLGNRHFGKNVRLIVINNGKGQEFRNYGCRAYQAGESTDRYVAAAGHNGNQSRKLLKNYSEDLGFKYISAENKGEYLNAEKIFLNKDIHQSIIFEIFTDTINETEALKIIQTLEVDTKSFIKDAVKDILGTKGVRKIKKIIKH